MKHSLLPSFLVAALLAPLAAFALDYSGSNLPYSDVRRGSPEAAAISLLTGEGVLEGYADGTFKPNQTLNRAEFLKIVLLSHSGTVISATDAANCFPDVNASDWFSRYVCYAKTHQIVGGYPDGFFRPANTVNYAEALKIMAELYDYPLDKMLTANWYDVYYRAAQNKGTTLPVALNFDAGLTRGQMARLAAAFLAESQGELSMYRQAERGIVPSSSSSSSSSSSVSSSSSSSSSVSSSSSSSSSALYQLPVKNAFLITGRATPIADVVLPVQSETVEVRATKIVLKNEVAALQSIDIYTSSGTKIITLTRRTTSDVDNYKQIYEEYVPTGTSGAYIAPNTTTRLVVIANIRTPENAGASELLLQMQTFTMTLHGKTSGITSTASFPPPFPQHQTSFGKITEVKRVGAVNGQLAAGTGLILGSFSFSGTTYPGKQLSIESLLFTPTISSNVTVTNWTLSSPQSSPGIQCTIGTEGITCAGITSDLGSIGSVPRILELRGNVSITPGSSGGSAQVVLTQAGSTSTIGSVNWTDGSGHFRWIESSSPVATGTLWQR